MNNSAVVPFYFQTNEIRTLSIDNEPWFVAADICAALGLGNVTMALERIPEGHKGVNPIEGNGGVRQVNTVDEPGLYRLILRSDKPQAEPFMEWVTSEVLPQIRKTGSYAMAGNDIDVLSDYIRLLRDERDRALGKIGKRKNFTQEEDEKVMELRAQGLSHRLIGLQVGRKPESIRSCLHRLGALR